jgi:hypothetical protein
MSLILKILGELLPRKRKMLMKSLGEQDVQVCVWINRGNLDGAAHECIAQV